MPTLNKETCPHCGQSINEREISLFKGMVDALFVVYTWCIQKGVNEFDRKDVKHLFKNENVSARFGDWVYFGGLVYKHGKGEYGLNLDRCEQFFLGKIAIPSRITKHPITGEIKKIEVKTVKQIPSLLSLLDDYKQFIARYGVPNDTIPMF